MLSSCMIIFNERNGRVELLAIDKPPKEFGTPLQTFREVLAHEKKVTALINNLYEIALKENDYATQVMLQWFINEQVEEENNASLIVDKLEMAGKSKGSLLNLDHHIGKRERNKTPCRCCSEYGVAGYCPPSFVYNFFDKIERMTFYLIDSLAWAGQNRCIETAPECLTKNHSKEHANGSGLSQDDKQPVIFQKTWIIRGVTNEV